MSSPSTISFEEANNLVLEHQGWAESIARSVARAWNLDWRLDGLDGAAMEALIFCSRRFDPARAVPFRGYARKRIHEASTEAARKSKSWLKGLGTTSKADQQARELSHDLFNVFPELRMGELPSLDDAGSDGSGDVRGAVRHLLVGASILSLKHGVTAALPDEMVDYKRMVEFVGALEPVHQILLWKVYWEGVSMRTVASEWDIDELNIIREHKVLLAHLSKSISSKTAPTKPKVRPGLREVALKLRKKGTRGSFTELISEGGFHDKEKR